MFTIRPYPAAFMCGYTGVPTSMCHRTCERSMTSEPPSRI